MVKKTPKQQKEMPVVTTGKTKQMLREAPGILVMRNSDDLSKKDGKEMFTLPRKGIWATRITRNCFHLLESYGIPTHLIGDYDERSLRVREADMQLVEVVIRGVATGSICKRYPWLEVGHVFKKPLVELFFKGKVKDVEDPWMVWDEEIGKFLLYKPSEPLGPESFLGILEDDRVPKSNREVAEIKTLARKVFELLRFAFLKQEIVLWDMKIEVGRIGGRLCVCDTIDPDCMRLKKHGKHVDKQIYRNAEEITAEVMFELNDAFVIVVEATDNFLPPAAASC